MIVDQNGKIIANATKPTVIFNKESDYNTWYNSHKTDADAGKYSIVKNYENVRLHIKGSSNNNSPSSVFNSEEKIDGHLYFYRYTPGGLTPNEDRLYIYIKDYGGFKQISFN